MRRLSKSLEILGSKVRTYYGVPNAQSLLLYAQQYELLPNLEILRLTAERSRKTESLFWVHVLASRSMRELCLLPNQHSESPLITASNASDLIKMTVKRCSDIRTLRVFAEHGALVHPQDRRANSLFANVDHEPLANTLAYATSLTRLVGNAVLLEADVLATLGRLPLLSDLEIVCTSHEWAAKSQDSDHASLSDGMFPLLDRLRLHDASEHHLKLLWDGPIPFSRLTSLEISLCARPTRLAIDLLNTNIPLLCQTCPDLTHLTLEFSQERHSFASCTISEDTFRHLERLPLTELIITGAALDLEVQHTRLVKVWPNMEVLIWAARSVPVAQLSLFARYMPKLRHLVLDIKVLPILDSTDMIGAAVLHNNTLRVLEGGFGQLVQYGSDEAYELQRYIFTLYPNTRLELWLSDEWKAKDRLFPVLSDYSGTSDSPSVEEASERLFRDKWSDARFAHN